MGKRDDFDDFFSDDEDTTAVDTRADGRLYRVPLGRLAANLVNPRTDFGTEDQLIDLGKSLARRQNQPCPVVSRGAYLKLWPDHDDRIGDVDYVLVSGERRYRSATAVGLPALDCVVNDDTATTRRSFLDAVVSENVDRQNFDPIEEAFAVQALVAEFGSNRAVAQHFDRVDGWVTQRVLLTHLAREVQDLVRNKTIPLEVARTLGKQTRDNGWDSAQQIQWWEQEQERRAAASAARIAARKAARQQPSVAAPPPVQPAAPPPADPAGFTAVKPEPVSEPAAKVRVDRGEPRPSASRPSAPQNQPPVVQEQPSPAVVPTQAAVPAPVSESRERKPPRFPYENAYEAHQHLTRKMPADQLEQLTDLLLEHREKQSAHAG